MKLGLLIAALGLAEGAHLRRGQLSATWLGAGPENRSQADATFIQGASGAAAAAEGGSAVDAEVGAMVVAMLEGARSMTPGHIIQQVNNKMSVHDAVHRLGDKLPSDIAALVRVGGRASTKQPFSEDSLQKARNILNKMVQDSQAEMDDVIIDCEEFKRSNRRTFDQVVTDLARLGSEIAEADEKIAENLQCIADQDVSFKLISDQLQDEENGYLRTRAEDDAELTLKKNDLAVFNFIMDITKCREEQGSAGSAGSAGNTSQGVFVQVGGNQSRPLRVCSTRQGFQLDFSDPKLQGKVDTMMTPGARLALREALGAAYGGRFASPAAMLQSGSASSGRSLERGAGTNNIHVAAQQDLCFAAEGDDPAEDSAIILAACNSDATQQFVLALDGSIRVRDEPNLCIQAAGTTADAKFKLVPCLGTPADTFEYKEGDKTIRSKSVPNLCISAEGLGAGDPLVFQPCTAAQGVQFNVPSGSSACIATVYEKADFTGWQASYTEGSYDFLAFTERGAQNEKVQSARISGNCKATLFQHGDFTGTSSTFAEGSYAADELKTRGVQNVTAIKVERVTTTGVPSMTLPIIPVIEAPAKEKQWKKCTDGKPNCGLLHDTMSLHWGKFKDLVDELQAEMEQNQDEWDRLKSNLNQQLKVIADLKGGCQTNFDRATGTKNTLTEERNEKDEQHHELTETYESKMAVCKARIEELLYTDVCAVRTVRNQVLLSSNQTPPSSITDCEVDEWVAEPCSVECDDSCPHMVGRQVDPYACGGWMTLNRKPIVQANQYGIKCPGLSRKTRCGQFKCSVDCEVSEWSGWSKCTKECEGGAQQMTRSVMVKPKHGGEACATTVETRACNTGSCDRDCSLNDWTAWSPCSMSCNPGDMPGFQERVRSVLVPIRGEGKCPLALQANRYEKQTCNEQSCQGDELCVAKQDLVIALDASGSMREHGFEVLRDFAANLTTRYKSHYLGMDTVQIGVILFGNGMRQTDDTISPAVNVVGLTDDLAMVAQKIKQTTWQKGFTNMAQAFVLADTMFQQGGRADAQSAVLVLSDGKYSFQYQTEKAVESLKGKNTAIFMAPVASRVADWEHKIKEWASQPWETNYELIPGFEDLEHNMHVFTAALVAKFCSDAVSPSREMGMENEQGYMLIHEGGLPDNSCGKYYDMGNVATVGECRIKAEQQMGMMAFAVGVQEGKRAKHCYAEAITVTAANWSAWQYNKANIPCPGGAWVENPIYDVYVVQPMAVGFR